MPVSGEHLQAVPDGYANFLQKKDLTLSNRYP